jgi:hypothetical protein
MSEIKAMVTAHKRFTPLSADDKSYLDVCMPHTVETTIGGFGNAIMRELRECVEEAKRMHSTADGDFEFTVTLVIPGSIF